MALKVRTATVNMYFTPSHSLVPVLPWATLTAIEMHLPISFSQAREILSRCNCLETLHYGTMYIELDNIQPWKHTVQPDHLLVLSLGFKKGALPDILLGSFSFPSICELVIHEGVLSSQFSLTFMITSALSTPSMQAFTSNPTTTEPRLILPHLEMFAVTESSENVDGSSLVLMVESLCKQTYHPGSAFPAPLAVSLSLSGGKFDSDIERRLATAT
ncbi:hypothetical protein C8J57DRAFT_1512338 [Mycena rebaudengoi]|nr:hypothetical protein C8J57DRAFT_1512338 [Mycena rebaudengoi]